MLTVLPWTTNTDTEGEDNERKIEDKMLVIKKLSAMCNNSGSSLSKKTLYIRDAIQKTIFQGIKLLIQISIKENIAGPMCPLYRAIFVYHNDVTGHIVNRPAICVWLGMARQEGKYNYYCIFKVEEAG